MREEVQREKTQKKPKTNLQELIDSGISCYYVKFQNPVAPGKDKEPVYEFKTKTDNPNDKKYVVEQMWWTPKGLVFKANGETDISPSANISLFRLGV